MNIVIVNPSNNPFTNKSILAEPIDALLIATIIEKKYDVKFIDMDVNRMKNNINSYLEEDNIVIFIYDYQIPLHTDLAINNIFETIRNINKKSKIIMIGKTSSYNPNYFINNGVDICIKGIADNILDVIDNINKIDKLKTIPNLTIKYNNEIINTKSIIKHYDYSLLPFPNRDLVDINKYMDTRTIITSRGCIHKCNFCPTHTFFGTWSYKKPNDVINEIKYLIEKYNTKKIMFLDDNMTVNKSRMYEICNLIKENNIKCLFGCLSSISCYDKDLFKLMFSCGFRWVHFGIESGSENTLKLMNKNMDIDYIKKVIKECKEMRFRVRTSIILDYPSTTPNDINLTLDLLKEVQPHEIRLHYLAYRPGTKVYEESDKTKSSYIHSNKPNKDDSNISSSINDLINELKKEYILIDKEIDFNIYDNYPPNTKFASLTTMKYGMCWYE